MRSGSVGLPSASKAGMALLRLFQVLLDLQIRASGIPCLDLGGRGYKGKKRSCWQDEATGFRGA